MTHAAPTVLLSATAYRHPPAFRRKTVRYVKLRNRASPLACSRGGGITGEESCERRCRVEAGVGMPVALSASSHPPELGSQGAFSISWDTQHKGVTPTRKTDCFDTGRASRPAGTGWWKCGVGEVAPRRVGARSEWGAGGFVVGQGMPPFALLPPTRSLKGSIFTAASRLLGEEAGGRATLTEGVGGLVTLQE